MGLRVSNLERRYRTHRAQGVFLNTQKSWYNVCDGIYGIYGIDMVYIYIYMVYIYIWYIYGIYIYMV